MFSSIVLAFAFVFGNSVRTVYESIIYLFVVHPFDVGDKIIVDSVSSKVRPQVTVLPVSSCCNATPEQLHSFLQQLPSCFQSFMLQHGLSYHRCKLHIHPDNLKISDDQVAAILLCPSLRAVLHERHSNHHCVLDTTGTAKWVCSHHVLSTWGLYLLQSAL